MILVDTFNRFKKIGWFLPGFILYAAFPPMCEVTDVLFALAPLLWLSRQGDPREAARRWLQSGLFFWLATLGWMPAIVKNGGPWPLVLLGLGALALYCSLYFAAFGYLSAVFWKWQRGRSPLLRLVGILLVEPVLWAGLELLRSRLLGGFAWNQLGVVPANAHFGAPAALGGVYLLSALVILVNGTFAGIAERVIAGIRARMRRPHDASALSRWRSAETFLALAVVWGVYGLSPAPRTAPQADATIKVAMVQRNFPCVFSEKAEDPYAAYSNLCANVALMKPDLVVLPESALSEFSSINHQGAHLFARWFGRTLADGAALLAGGTLYGDGNTYNSAALFENPADGSPRVTTYDKVHLVPFGEFIPGDKAFPILQKLAPVGSCTPGDERLLDLAVRGTNVPFAVAICFEDTDSALLRRQAARGARFLAFITNDSWFSHSNEALAHAWQATARALETGLPVVRVGNSGVTETIRPDGSVNRLVGADDLPLVDRRGVLFDRIGLAAPKALTPYVRLGDAPLAVLASLVVLALLILRRRLSRQATTTTEGIRRRGGAPLP